MSKVCDPSRIRQFTLHSTQNALDVNRKVHQVIKTVFFILLLQLATDNKLIANSSSTNMLVSATVASSCTLSNGTLSFGKYDPVGANDAAPMQSTGSLKIKCTRDTTATIGLDNGQHPGQATGTSRAMASTNGGDYLGYDIYTDSAYSAKWTNSNTVNYTAASNAISTINVYGLIPPNQNVHDDVYSDIITIVATF